MKGLAIADVEPDLLLSLLIPPQIPIFIENQLHTIMRFCTAFVVFAQVALLLAAPLPEGEFLNFTHANPRHRPCENFEARRC
jgi:hypothetical protein